MARQHYRIIGLGSTYKGTTPHLTLAGTQAKLPEVLVTWVRRGVKTTARYTGLVIIDEEELKV